MTPNFFYMKEAYSAHFSELKEVVGENIRKESQAFVVKIACALTTP
jgi:hypothetical protein